MFSTNSTSAVSFSNDSIDASLSCSTLQKVQHAISQLDLAVEVPLIVVNENNIEAVVELHSGNEDLNNENIHAVSKVLKNEFPDRSINFRCYQVLTAFSPKEIFSVRQFVLANPNIVSIELDRETRCFQVERSNSKKLVRESVLLRAFTPANEASFTIIVENSMQESTFIFAENTNKIINTIWGESQKHNQAINVFLDNTTNRLLVAYDGDIRKQVIATKKVDLNSRLKDAPALNQLQIEAIQTQVPRDTYRFIVEELPDGVNSLRIQALHTVINIVGLTTEADLAQKFYSAIKRVTKGITYPIKYHLIQNASTTTESVFHIAPIDWHIEYAEISQNAVYIKCKNPPYKNKIDADIQKAIRDDLDVSEIYINDDGLDLVDITSPVSDLIHTVLPTGLGIKGILQNRVTRNYVITTATPISDAHIQRLSEELHQKIENRISPDISTYSDQRFTRKIIALRNAGAIIPVTRKLRTNNTTLTAYGACQEIGGSCLLLKLPEATILLDYGARFDKSPVDILSKDQIADIDFIILSHAHRDHTGWLASLIEQGCMAQVLATGATLTLTDFISGLQYVSGSKVIPKLSFDRLTKQSCILTQNVRYKLADNTHVTLYNSGHLLGSSMVLVESDQKRILYSGDILYGRSLLHEPAELPKADILIMEGTYGGRNLPNRELIEQQTLDAVIHTLEQGGSVLAPVLVCGRAQELLALLSRETDKIRRLGTIYIDGAIPDANMLYSYFSSNQPTLFNPAIRKFTKNIFSTDSIARPISSNNRQGVMYSDNPRIIIASSGMLEGLSLQYFEAMRRNPKNCLLQTCYQVPNTTGSQLGEYLESNGAVHSDKFSGTAMQIKKFSLSGHSDQSELLKFVQHVEPSIVFLNHGAQDQLDALSNAIRGNSQNSHILQRGLSYSLNSRS